MKKILLIALFMIPLLVQADRPNIILDTDMTADVDDLGALQSALYLHRRGVINLKAVTLATSGSQNHKAVKHMLDWWGYGDSIRVGININGNGGGASRPVSGCRLHGYINDNKWIKHFNNRYGNFDIKVEDSVNVIKDILDNTENVSLIVVGAATNIKNVISAGGLPSLNKANKISLMGGNVNGSPDCFNIMHDINAAQQVTSLINTRIEYYDGFSRNPATGGAAAFKNVSNEQSRTRFGYYTYNPNDGTRWSWDLVTLMGAIYSEKYFKYIKGDLSITSGSVLKSNQLKSKEHYYARYSSAESANTVGSLLNFMLGSIPDNVQENRTTEKESGLIIINFGDLILPIKKS